MNTSFWDENSKAWNEVIDSGGIASRAVTNAAILEAVLKTQASAVLDFGCGEGWLVSALQKKGFTAFGVDASRSLIDIAKEKHPACSFLACSYSEIEAQSWEPPLKFSTAVFNFSLLDENISSLLLNVSNNLEKGGRILIQTLHPCFVALPEYKSAWQQEDFASMKVAFQGNMPWFSRTLEAWSKEFTKADLVIEKIQEPMFLDKPASILFTLK